MPFLSCLALFSTAFVSTFGLSFLAHRFFPRWGLMDRPERYGHDRAPIPYPGGVAVVLGILFTVLHFLPLSPSVLAVLLATLLLAITCFWDDRRGLSPYLRFAIQIVAALLLVLGGLGVSSITNPFGPEPLLLDVWEFPVTLGQLTFTFTILADLLTVAWVVAMVNAFNWIDGVPGMASGVSSVASFVLLVLSMRPGFHSVDQTLAVAFSAILFGASLAFLYWDFPKPKMLLGDTGSMVLGFLLAVTAFISGGKIATTFLVLSFPFFDFVWVLLRRLFKGQSPFKGDLWHLHHRLQKAGYSDRGIVLFYTLSSALFGSLALLLHTEGKLLALILVLGFMLLLMLLLYSKKPAS
ncbi:undecaprenyl/decaprenyl-phosphate alpha-N-acetylglucosaminyl 1-phosphate transferase [Candidatus Peregrinibacteria bacterium]|nr:MAG: undecaprenyl/decaprenyl-phosphate alpha-N-acetylglucosaminyl 1-phosphate transferase [Candidatus Peregrinibacteria bacterium]